MLAVMSDDLVGVSLILALCQTTNFKTGSN